MQPVDSSAPAASVLPAGGYYFYTLILSSKTWISKRKKQKQMWANGSSRWSGSISDGRRLSLYYIPHSLLSRFRDIFSLYVCILAMHPYKFVHIEWRLEIFKVRNCNCKYKLYLTKTRYRDTYNYNKMKLRRKIAVFISTDRKNNTCFK